MNSQENARLSTTLFGGSKPKTNKPSKLIMKSSFKQVPTQAEPAEETSTTLAKPMPPMAQFSGDWDYSDTRKPRITLVHKTSDSELIADFGIRTFVLNK